MGQQPPSFRVSRRGPSGALESAEFTSAEVSIGRDPTCDLSVPDFGLSGRHASILVRAGRIWLLDTKSKGGTRLNGRPIVEAELVDGDTFTCGQVQFWFESKGRETTVVVSEERAAVVRKIAEIAARNPESIGPETRLSDLGDSLPKMLFLTSQVQTAFGVQLAWDELIRINTIGELSDLIVKAQPSTGSPATNPDEWPSGFFRRFFSERGARLLACDSAFCWAVTQGGRVVRVDIDDAGNSVEPEEDRRYVYALLTVGARVYPELNGLIPERPSDMAECQSCSGAAAAATRTRDAAGSDRCSCRFGWWW